MIQPEQLNYDERGLIPAVIQDDATGTVLMVAYMNQESLRRTMATGRTCFFSRSRQAFWVKGETSGHIQLVRSIFTDCDRDTLLIRVEQHGVACHEGTFTCFTKPLQQEEDSHQHG